MRYRASAVAALAGAILLCAAGAAAQETIPAPVREFELVPAGWTFTPNIAVGWVYDSNVGLVDTGVGFEKQADQLFLIVPSGELMYLGKYTRFASGYRGALLRYRTIDAFDAFDQHAWGSLNRRLSPRATIFANGSYQRSPTTDDLLLNGVVFRRTGARNANLIGGVDVGLSRATDLHVQYEFVAVHLNHDQGQPGLLLGGRSHGVEAEVMHRLTPRLSLGGVYNVRFADLDSVDEGSPLVPAKTLQFHNGGAAVALELNPSTSLTGAAGIAVLDHSRRPDLAVGPFVRVALTHRAQRLTSTVQYYRAAVPTFGFAASSMSEQIRGSVHMPVYRNRVYVQAFGSWRRTDPLAEGTLQLHTVYARSTVGVAVARALRVEGFYYFTRQDTRVPGGLVVRHRLGAQLVLGMPMRIN